MNLRDKHEIETVLREVEAWIKRQKQWTGSEWVQMDVPAFVAEKILRLIGCDNE